MDLETKTAIGEALNAFEGVKTELLGIKKQAGDLDAETKGRFEKMAAEITKGVEASLKAEAKAREAEEAVKARDAADKILEVERKAMEEKMGLLEAAFNRPLAAAPSFQEKTREVAQTRNKLFNAFARRDFGNEQVYFDQFLKKEIPDEAERKAMSVNSDPDGGYLVDPEYGGIIKTFEYETSPLRQVARTITIGTDAIEWVLDNDQADAGWVAETAPRPETGTPRLGVLTIPTHEIYAQPKVTQKFLDDAKIDVESWLSGKVADIFTRKENTAFMVGDGNGKPRGFLTYNAGTDPSQRQIQQINSGNASNFNWQSLIALQFSLKDPYQANASFILNRTAMGALLATAGSDGHPIYTSVVDPANGYLRERINGKKALFASDMPEMAANALVAAYGDFRRGYLIVDRMGIRVLRDPYTDKPFVKFYTTKRVGGEVINSEAIKLLKVAA
ncbi:phage major capsid protein [Tundrisphaera sp. TA3]|uniref:phage major capsid protein n=1 Tax=Tundrisphaera sp. TA3 TaxID=3435775 RepID=UPI003EBEF861